MTHIHRSCFNNGYHVINNYVIHIWNINTINVSGWTAQFYLWNPRNYIEFMFPLIGGKSKPGIHGPPVFLVRPFVCFAMQPPSFSHFFKKFCMVSTRDPQTKNGRPRAEQILNISNRTRIKENLKFSDQTDRPWTPGSNYIKKNVLPVSQFLIFCAYLMIIF